MNSPRSFFAAISFVLVGLLAGCDHTAPLTAEATGAADARLVGDWAAYADGKSALMLIRGYDAKNLSVAYDGQLYRVWASTIGTEPFLTVQILNGEKASFVYANYRFEKEGRELVFRIVQHRVVPETASVAEAQEILRKQPPFQKDSTTEDLIRFTRLSPVKPAE